jgi:hypothetical protein
LQVTIFPDPQQGRELLDAIRAFKPDVIYFDGTSHGLRCLGAPRHVGGPVHHGLR